MRKTRVKQHLLLTAAAFAFTANFALAADGDASDIETVRVESKKPDLDAAVEQINAANLVSVLTPAGMSRTPDVNVAEALSRIPGIAVLDGGTGNTNGVDLDFAARGQGNFVSVRGMDAEFNINLINGIEVAQGKPFSRQVQLNLLPPSGLQRIVVNKSLTANQQGDAIGGVVDFRTPTGFDFAADQHFSATLSGQYNSRADDYNRDPYGFGVSGEYAVRPLSTLALYASAYYDRSHFTNSIIDGGYPAATNGQWTYALQKKDGSSASGGDASQNLVLTGLNAGFTDGTTKRYGGNFSIDWHISDDASLFLRTTTAFDKIDQASYYAQIYGETSAAQQIGTTGVYTPLITTIRPRYYYETAPEDASLHTGQIGGNFRFGALHLSPAVFLSYGEYNAPDHMEISARRPESGAAFPYNGSTMFTYVDGVPMPTLTAAQYAQVSDVGSYGSRRSGEFSPEFSHQLKWGVKLDGSYDINEGVFKALDFGVYFRDSHRGHTYRDYTSNKIYTSAYEPPFSSLGIISGSVPNLVPGTFNFSAPLISRPALDKLFYAAIIKDFGSLTNASDQCSGIVNSENCDTQRGSETVTAVYGQAHLDFGDVDAIVGLRFEHTDIHNIYWTIPTDKNGNTQVGYFSSNDSSYDKPLPSLSVNWRPSDTLVVRGAISQSYVRPSFFQLGGGEQISNSGGGAASGGTTSITRGNPNLKAIDAVNFDLSAQWAGSFGTTASLGGFYKKLDNFIYSQTNNFTNLTSEQETGSTTISQPMNGGDGYVYGIEAAFSQQFTAMPAPLNGLGIAGNFTYEQSGVHTKVVGLKSTERLLNQPNIMTNLQLFYSAGPYEADLSYRYTGSYVSRYAAIGGTSDLDGWVRAHRQLDLHLGYSFDLGLKANFSVTNLTGEDSYRASIGRTSDIIPSFVDSGRTVMFSVTYAQ